MAAGGELQLRMVEDLRTDEGQWRRLVYDRWAGKTSYKWGEMGPRIDIYKYPPGTNFHHEMGEWLQNGC